MISKIHPFDERRKLIIPGDKEETILYAAENFLTLARSAIEKQGTFSVALSGGSTPQAIFQAISQSSKRDQVDWKRVKLFWSDERSVPSDHLESNYRMAMESGFSHLPIPSNQIYRMKAEGDIEKAALEYEKTIQDEIPKGSFDLIMLGLGEDGHIASLFPESHGLHAVNRLVIGNYIAQKHTWRMSLTFEAINQALFIALYVIGDKKADIVDKVLHSPYDPEHLPAQKIGTEKHNAFWIMDRGAASKIMI